MTVVLRLPAAMRITQAIHARATGRADGARRSPQRGLGDRSQSLKFVRDGNSVSGVQSQTPLDSATILSATEEVLRRHGPSKATVVDVARSLGVSHTAVYRHFPSKAALREAVARRWLNRANDDLVAIAGDSRLAPPDRLRGWLVTLFTVKRTLAGEDPELFAMYETLVAEHSSAAEEYVAGLLVQLQNIIGDGVAAGDFTATALEETATAVFDATTRFHHPAHAAEWSAPRMDAALDRVCTLLLDGLSAE
jgi:AcrR family transcriptional regulator